MASILLIEDDPDVVDLYRIALEDAGHTIWQVFDDPAKALEAAASQEAHPHAAILDERLRGRSGTAFLSDLRRAYPDTRFLLATADPKAAAAALQMGAHAVKEKPFLLDELVEAVVRMLEGS